APASFEQLLEKMYTAGSHGVYVCGQTGEGLLLPVALREQAAEIAVRCSPAGKTVMVHVGSHRTADAVRLAAHAERVGAHAISSLPPLGNYSFAEIKEYYRSIAAASSLPVFVYYFPEIAPAISTADQIFELCEIPNVAGLKFTDFDLYKLGRVRAAGNVLFNGRDEILVAGLLMGADGGIGTFYNLVPELFVQVYDLALAGKWDEAKKVQDRINRLITVVLRFPLFPAIKEILGWSGIDCGQCVAPRRRLTSEERMALRSALHEAGFAALAGAAATV
ncbi:MAG: dihydrodipicolinate synthase family protein, partial [Bryobacteraceae bacterium]|nr:dihydrodipicolinate synthase family protein [Bryobacteraceae bacterium]